MNYEGGSNVSANETRKMFVNLSVKSLPRAVEFFLQGSLLREQVVQLVARLLRHRLVRAAVLLEQAMCLATEAAEPGLDVRDVICHMKQPRPANYLQTSSAGTGCGMLVGLLAAAAIVASSFWLFCLATFFGGAYAAVVLSFRFAAADGVSPALRARALSFVMGGGVVAGVAIMYFTAFLVKF